MPMQYKWWAPEAPNSSNILPTNHALVESFRRSELNDICIITVGVLERLCVFNVVGGSGVCVYLCVCLCKKNMLQHISDAISHNI